jgi:3-oxoacyl-[acyl-carrier-protein] synthase-3
MSIFSFKNVGISAIAACVPQNRFSNENLEYLVPKDTLDKMIASIGIKEKRIVDNGVCASDLCYKAAKKLMEDNKIEPSSINMVLFLSMAPDFITPPTSVILQHKLGLTTSTACLDLSMACSGFIYALSTAFAFASTKGINRVLVLVGETMSKFANPRDRVNFPLYGDAGTACLVEKGDFEDSTFLLNSDGEGEDVVKIPHGGFRNFLTEESLIDKEREEGNFRRDVDITMDGLATFNHAVTVIPKQIKLLMSEANITPDDVDFLISHQANKFMIDFIIKRLKFDPSKVPFCLEKFGNTSCASIPLTIVSELSKINLLENKRLLMTAIGAGWSFGTCYLQTKRINISKLIEY